MGTFTADESATQIASQLGEVHDQILGMTREATKLCLDAYEKTVDSIASYHEQAASRTDVDWITVAARQQAQLIRELGTRQVAMGRELLK